jgi:plasmid stability protein
MGVITVRGIDDQTKELVRAKAKRNGRSLEAEVRQIIAASVNAEDSHEPVDTTLDIGSQIRSLFNGSGDGLELPLRAGFQREVAL